MRQRFLAVVSLAACWAAATTAQSPHDEMNRSYTGCLESSDQGFTLATNGRRIALNGDVAFNEHIGHTVKVTGQQEGDGYLVSSLEHLSATCDPEAAAATSPSADSRDDSRDAENRAREQAATTTDTEAVNARDREPLTPDARAQAREAGDRNIAENDRPARPSTDRDDVVKADPREDVEPRADVDVNARARLHDDDRDSQDRVTADDQSNTKSDRKTTAAIRKSIVKDDSLSIYAHNVKVITREGRVTLRGPVRSAAEKATVAAKAEKIVGAGAVDDQMTVEPDSDAHPPNSNEKEK